MQLIRRTLSALEAELDTGRLGRIDRWIIVASARTREMKPLANGDATRGLVDGHELRMSRPFRETVRELWAGR